MKLEAIIHAIKLRCSYVEYQIKSYHLFRHAWMLSLFTGAFHLFLLTLEDSVVREVFPSLVSASSLSLFLLYHYVSFIFFVCYLLCNYRLVTFANMHENKWYPFMLAGFSPYAMIFITLIQRLLEALISYTAGFLFVFGIAVFLRYPFLMEQLPFLYMIQAVDVLLITLMSMAGSLFFRQTRLASYTVLVYGGVLLSLKVMTHETAILHDAIRLQDLLHFFHPAKHAYMFYAAVLTAISVILMVWYVIGKRFAYINYDYYLKDMELQNGVTIIMKHAQGTYPVKESYYRKEAAYQWIFHLIRLCMSIVITCLIFMNLLVMVVSVSSIHPQWNFFKIHPIVVLSNSMEPEIHNHDLVFFTQNTTAFKKQDIIVYRSYTRKMNIARIMELKPNSLIVDLDKYPNGYPLGSLQEEIGYEQIEGSYIGSSRWLGVLILFANTWAGRILLLLCPCILIFYYRQISVFISDLKHK